MFKIYKNAIDQKLIDKIVNNHQQFKHSFLSFFRAQGTTSFEKPLLDSFGNQMNSIQNPHLLGFKKSLRISVLEALYSDSLFKNMVNFSGEDEFVHYQSMFFDKSTGTALHQDTWYLDTDPPGKLFGVWIALEDIDDSCGPFYLFKNGPNCLKSPKDYNYQDIINDKNFKQDYPNAEVFKFYAKKGDVVIWDSFNFHGAYDPSSSMKTRKSITGHFYPKGTNIQKQPIKRRFSVYNHKKTIKTSHARITSAGTINPYFYSLICLILFSLKGLSKIFTNDNKSDKGLTEIRNLNE